MKSCCRSVRTCLCTSMCGVKIESMIDVSNAVVPQCDQIADHAFKVLYPILLSLASKSFKANIVYWSYMWFASKWVATEQLLFISIVLWETEVLYGMLIDITIFLLLLNDFHQGRGKQWNHATTQTDLFVSSVWWYFLSLSDHLFLSILSIYCFFFSSLFFSLLSYLFSLKNNHPTASSLSSLFNASIYWCPPPYLSRLTLIVAIKTNPGKYTAIKEIEFCKKNNLKYYYMGFYIHSCKKMRYKGEYEPSELLCPTALDWHPYKKSVSLLDKNKFTPLNDHFVQQLTAVMKMENEKLKNNFTLTFNGDEEHCREPVQDSNRVFDDEAVTHGNNSTLTVNLRGDGSNDEHENQTNNYIKNEFLSSLSLNEKMKHPSLKLFSPQFNFDPSLHKCTLFSSTSTSHATCSNASSHSLTSSSSSSSSRLEDPSNLPVHSTDTTTDTNTLSSSSSSSACPSVFDNTSSAPSSVAAGLFLRTNKTEHQKMKSNLKLAKKKKHENVISAEDENVLRKEDYRLNNEMAREQEKESDEDRRKRYAAVENNLVERIPIDLGTGTESIGPRSAAITIAKQFLTKLLTALNVDILLLFSISISPMLFYSTPFWYSDMRHNRYAISGSQFSWLLAYQILPWYDPFVWAPTSDVNYTLICSPRNMKSKSYCNEIDTSTTDIGRGWIPLWRLHHHQWWHHQHVAHRDIMSYTIT